MMFISEYKFNGKTFEGLNSIYADKLKGYDIIIITAAHSNVDYDFVAANYKWVFDTKNATKSIENRRNIVLL